MDTCDDARNLDEAGSECGDELHLGNQENLSPGGANRLVYRPIRTRSSDEAGILERWATAFMECAEGGQGAGAQLHQDAVQRRGGRGATDPRLRLDNGGWMV